MRFFAWAGSALFSIGVSLLGRGGLNPIFSDSHKLADTDAHMLLWEGLWAVCIGIILFIILSVVESIPTKTGE